MLGIGLALQQCATRTTGGGYLPEAKALFARMADAGSEPDSVRKARINTFFATIKKSAPSLLGKLDAFVPFYAHEPSAVVNWVQGAYNPSVINAPVFTADYGYSTGAGYIDTNFNPATAGGKFLQNNAYFGFFSLSASALDGSWAGRFSGGGTTLAPRNGTNLASGRLNSSGTIAKNEITDATGLWAVKRSDAVNITLSQNGNELNTAAAASSAPFNGNLLIGTITGSSPVARDFGGYVIGAFLTQQEEAALYEAWATFRGA